MAVLGLHHVTAIAGDPRRNAAFYGGVLGLRLVKRTVNFDDPSTWHCYFGDETGSPGSLITFFAWPDANPGRAGTGQVGVTGLAIAPASIGFWIERLLRFGVAWEGPVDRAGVGAPGERVLAFRDPDGLLVELVADPRALARSGWTGAPDIPAEHAIRGLHGVTLWAEAGDETARILADTLGFRPGREGPGIRRFEAGDGGPGAIVDLRTIGGFPAGAEGPGAVHHVAWRVADDPAQAALRARVEAAGLSPTPVRDRHYFRSVYFREPGGVLFEMATDGPGFTVDESVGALGLQLSLPDALEPYRAEIAGRLPPFDWPPLPAWQP